MVYRKKILVLSLATLLPGAIGLTPPVHTAMPLVAQNNIEAPEEKNKTPIPANKDVQKKTDENQTSTGGKKKPVKTFRPSERIEAEQAVDFPYDI